MAEVDLNRPLTIRVMPDGKRVCMDKSQPGIWFDGAGVPLGDKEAAAAGFDVKRLTMERKKNEAMRSAQAEIERAHKVRMAELERIMTASFNGHTLDIVKGSDKSWIAVDEDGNLVTSGHYTRKADLIELFEMAGLMEAPVDDETERETPQVASPPLQQEEQADGS